MYSKIALTQKIITILFMMIVSVVPLSSCINKIPISARTTELPTNYETEFNNILRTAESPNNHFLLLNITIDEGKCYAVNTDIPIKIDFINTSPNPLFLQNSFIFYSADIKYIGERSAADIIVSIYLSDGTKAYREYFLNDEYWPPLNKSFIKIAPHSIYDIEISYRFPDKIIISKNDQILSSENQIYDISIVYRNYDPLEIGAWVGRIESNRIKICIE